MTCPDCLARLAEHWDEPRTEVAQHLRDCAACRGEWERLSAALELLEQEPRPAAPDLRAAIWAQLAAQPPVRSGERWLGLASAGLWCAALWWWLTPYLRLPAWPTLQVDWAASQVALGGWAGALPARLAEWSAAAGSVWREVLWVAGSPSAWAPAQAGAWLVVTGLVGAAALEAAQRRAGGAMERD